jgi:hypothetical protein
LPGGAPPEEEVLGGAGHLGFDAPEAGPLGPALARALARRSRARRLALHTPLGLEHVADLDRAALVYDVMERPERLPPTRRPDSSARAERPSARPT